MISEKDILSELSKFDASLLRLGESVTDNRFEILEQQIGYSLPITFKNIVKKYNSISLCSTTIYGLDESFKDCSLDRLYEIEHFEVENPMPKELFPFSGDGYGNHYCFDLSLSEDMVLFWQHDLIYSNKSEIEITNTSFIEWIQEVMINWTLEEINYDGSEK